MRDLLQQSVACYLSRLALFYCLIRIAGLEGFCRTIFMYLQGWPDNESEGVEWMEEAGLNYTTDITRLH